jgi:UPF0755 protein
MDDFLSEQNQPIEAESPYHADFLRRRKWTIIAVGIGMLLIIGLAFLAGLSPASANGAQVTIVVTRGQGFFEVAKALDAAHLLRSRLIFEAAAILSGDAFHVQAGIYRFSPEMSGTAILHELSNGAPSVTVTIPEGSDIYEIDKMLAGVGVIARGELINFKSDGDLEGKLFPDTYQFFEGSNISSVSQKFLDNFNEKAAPLLSADSKNTEQNLTLASIIEKEAPDSRDQSIIAGIILKRIADGMRLQIDPTVCYAKQITLPSEAVDCSALTRADFSSGSPYDSEYNTYLHAGLPPGPIGNPGIAAITAALHPASSSYWYYLSDPATGKVIYAATLAEQNANIKKYLGN